MPCRIPALLVAAMIVFPGRAQQNNSDAVLRATRQEVLLDFVARDKHNKLVTSLRPDEVEIYEDGVRQKPLSFRYREGREILRASAASPPGTPAKAVYDPLREINLVSIVFERMSLDSRARGTQAVHDFLRSGMLPNTWVGVFTLNHRLAVLQPWTTNLALLNRAVDEAATGNYLEFARNSEQIAKQFNDLRAANGAVNSGDPGRSSGSIVTASQSMDRPDTFQPVDPGSAEERGPDLGIGQAMRNVLISHLQGTLQMMFQQEGYRSIDALRSLIRAQSRLPGRKTVLYLSDGLVVPPEQPELLKAIIGQANRANITFFTVDTRGLSMVRSQIIAAANTDLLNRSTMTDAPGGELGPTVQQTNVQLNLRQLAEDTGGFAMDNSNDLRAPLQRAMEEVSSHYEVTYTPTSPNYDGHFRVLSVKVSRPGLRIESRKGYFALPLLNGEPMAPFEMAALGALNAQPAPHAFDYHVAALHFKRSAEGVDYRVVFSVPTTALRFTEDAVTKRFRLRVSVIGLIKDDQGQIVDKITRDLPYIAPIDKEAEFRKGEVTIALPLRLRPGRYHLDTAVLDREADAASTHRSVLIVPPADAAPGLSDIVFVSSVQPDDDRDPANPLEFSGGRVSPQLEPVLSKSAGGSAMFYFVVYPLAASKPDVQMTILHDGEPIAVLHPALPALDQETGGIPVMSEIPLAKLEPGEYEIAVTASQDGAAARSQSLLQLR